MAMRSFLTRLASDATGAMAIETAIVAPVLATMALGAFEASNVVSRQQDLQSAANEASVIILAAAGGTGVSSADLEDILEASLGLQDSQLQLAQRYRCDDSGTVTAIKPTTASCGNTKPIYTYVQLTLTDTYTPIWTEFGVGEPVNYNVVRMVQVS